MGSNFSVLYPCYSQAMPSSRNNFDDLGWEESTNLRIKKLSIASSETISIAPVAGLSNQSSVAEFSVHKDENSSENHIRMPYNTKLRPFNSTAEVKKNSFYEANYKNSKKDAINLVCRVRTRSFTDPKSDLSRKNTRSNTFLRKNCEDQE